MSSNSSSQRTSQHYSRNRGGRQDRDRPRYGHRSRSRDGERGQHRSYSRNGDVARRHASREYEENKQSGSTPSYKTKGRGHDPGIVEPPSQSIGEYPYNSRLCSVGVYESIGESGAFRGTGPQRSVNGWALFVTNIHEEATEDDFIDLFSDFGKVQSVVLNTDRSTGRAKGYALVEFGEYTEAQVCLLSCYIFYILTIKSM